MMPTKCGLLVSPLPIHHGKLFLKIELDGKKLNGIFYDTGSSPDALMVDFSVWKQATGRSGKDATTHTSGQSWGRNVEFICPQFWRFENRKSPL